MVEILGSMPWESFSAFEKKAFDRILKDFEIPGFRKGHVPLEMAKSNIKDELILADMAELAVQAIYPTILVDKKIDALGSPNLAITKLARDNELSFTIRTAVLPVIALPEYKTIAAAVKPSTPAEISEEDIDKVVQDLRQIRAYGHVHDHAEENDHGHDESQLPEVNDDFAKSFGNFASVAEMRDKIRENMKREKQQEANDKRRVTIMEDIIAKTSFAVPVIVIKSEQEKILAQIETDIARSGMTLEDYFKQVQKTREQVMEEFLPEAEKRARFQLIINAIAHDAGVMATEEEANAEADSLVKAYPGADRARALAYADMVITNEKVLAMLEQQQ